MKSKCLKNRTVPIYFVCLLSIIISAIPILTAKAVEETKEEKISLDLKNIEVMELLRILSLKTGKTIVPSKDIVGRITVFLNNVTVKDVLDIIVLNQGYALEKKGNIYYIMSNADYKGLFGRDYIEQRKLKTIRLTYAKPANVFNALSQLKSDMGKIIADEATGTLILIDIPEKLLLLENAAQELDRPLQTTVYDLNYAKAADAKTQLTAAITPGTGEVIVDERSGKAIVSDLPQKMERINRIVKEIDEETRQVFIETEIIEVSLSDKFQRGIDWEKVFSERSLDGLDFTGYFPMTLATYAKIAVGTLASNRYKAAINFLETYGDTKIISQPRIAAVNNEEARIMVGTREAYVTQTMSQAETTQVTAESIEFIDVGVKLKIVPTIHKDGFITMKIKPEVSSVKELITSNLGSRIPIVQTSEAETVVKVKDGTMIMIAGLIKEEKRDTIKRVPFISKIPFLGPLFSNREKENNRSEMIIFITPHLTRGDSVLPGYEAEKIIPKEIMPETVKRKLVREEAMISSLEFPAKLEEAKRIEEEAQKLKEAKKISEAEKLEKGKQEAAKKLEDAKKQAEAKRLEESNKVEKRKNGAEAEKLEEARQKAEAKKAEELKKAEQLERAEKAKQEAAKKLEDAKKQAEAKRLEESNKVEKRKKAAEAEKLEEARQKAEAKKAEELKKAEEVKEATEAKAPDRIKAAELYQKGMELQKSNSLNEAKDYFLKALDADAKFAIAYNQLGIIYETAGLVDQAEKMYLKTIEIDPQCKAVYSNLALLNEAKGDNKKAILYWQKRAELGEPNDPWTKEAIEHLKKLKNNGDVSIFNSSSLTEK